MTDVEMVSIGLDKMQQSFLKNDAVRYKPYAERISIALAFKLLAPSNPRFNPFSVIDEMDYLEGLHIATKTKPESQFRKKPLYPFWHKHYFYYPHSSILPHDPDSYRQNISEGSSFPHLQVKFFSDFPEPDRK